MGTRLKGGLALKGRRRCVRICEEESGFSSSHSAAAKKTYRRAFHDDSVSLAF